MNVYLVTFTKDNCFDNITVTTLGVFATVEGAKRCACEAAGQELRFVEYGCGESYSAELGWYKEYMIERMEVQE